MEELLKFANKMMNITELRGYTRRSTRAIVSGSALYAAQSLKVLLESKFLYQVYDIEEKMPVFTAKDFNVSDEYSSDFEGWANSFFRETLLRPWVPNQSLPKSPSEPTDALPDTIEIALPTLLINCENKGCKSVDPAHNPEPFYSDGRSQFGARALGSGPIVQLFHLKYRCQSCKQESICFMVRREGLKLKIVGRSHFQSVAIPSCFKGVSEGKYYSNAVIADRTGNTLAGFFFLRTMIEQFMRRNLGIEDRLDLESMADRYSKELLHDEFPSQSVPSMKRLCDELGDAIHSASECSEAFSKLCVDIEKNFGQLQLLPFKTIERDV